MKHHTIARDIVAPSPTVPWEIDVPAHGVIKELNFYKPKSGTTAGCTFNIYTSKEAAEAAIAAVAGVNWFKANALFATDQTYTGTLYESGAVNIPYVNADAKQTNRKRKLYIVSNMVVDNAVHLHMVIELPESC